MARYSSEKPRHKGIFERAAGALGGSRLAKFAALGALALVPGVGAIAVAAYLSKGIGARPGEALRTGVQALTAGSPNLGRVAAGAARGVGNAARSSVGPGWGR